MNEAQANPAPPPEDDYGYRKGTNPYLIACITGLAAFIEVLDTSIANVSLRNIASGLGAGQDEATWVLTSYLVANAIVLPISGWLSTMFGRTRFYIASIIVFTLSSMICGIAPSLPLLVFFRVVQGLGGGALQPVSQAIMADAFPPAKLAAAFSIYGLAVVVAPAIGPTLGGWITDTYSWRWIFLLNVPIGLALAALTRYYISDPRAFTRMRKERLRSGFRIDYLGFGLITLGLGALQIMFDKGQQKDWFSSDYISTLGVIAVVALIGAGIWEWRHKDPVVNLRLMKHANFSIGIILMFVLGFVLTASSLLMPTMTQTLFGYSATDAGIMISPAAILIAMTMPFAGAFASRVDPRKMVLFGMVCLVLGMYYTTYLDLSADYHTLVVVRMCQTFGLAFIYIPISAISFTGLPPEESGNASALTNLARNFGGSVGTSLVTTMVTRYTAMHEVTLGAHISKLDPQYVGTVKELSSRFGGGAAGQQKAVGLLANMMEQQASMLAYIDVFGAMALITVLLMPMILLMKRPTEPISLQGPH